jgi:hypothetical protein
MHHFANIAVSAFVDDQHYLPDALRNFEAIKKVVDY